MHSGTHYSISVCMIERCPTFRLRLEVKYLYTRAKRTVDAAGFIPRFEWVRFPCPLPFSSSKLEQEPTPKPVYELGWAPFICCCSIKENIA